MRREGKISALILAAGYSSRIGTLKPLLPIGGSTAMEEAIKRFLEAGIEDIRVVVGHRADDITPLLDNLGVQWVLNEHFDRGMLSSVLTGVKSLEPDVEAFFLLPVDIPLVKSRTLDALIQAYQSNRPNIAYPRFQGLRGHPPLIATACMAQTALHWDHPGGLRAFLTRYENEACDIDVVDQAILMDCDTDQDWRKLRAYGRREDIPTQSECVAIWDRFKLTGEVRLHCRLVAELTGLLAIHLNRAGVPLNPDLALAAGYLHDLAKGQKDHARAGAAILDELGYPRVGQIVASHMDIHVKRRYPDESDLVYLADKCVEDDKLVTLEERFSRSLDKFASKPEALKAIAKRLKDARKIKERLETFLGQPLEDILQKYRRNIHATSLSGPRRIYLARHGALRLPKDGNAPNQGRRYIGQSDIPLSDEGIQQALNLREELRHVHLSAIYSSDLTRCLKTAEIVGEPHQLRPTPRRDLREILLGRWEGKTFNEIKHQYPEEFEERGRDIVHFRPLGGESFLDCTHRALRAFYDILHSTEGNILIVAHAGVNRILLSQAMGKSLENLFEIPQDYGCLNLVDYSDFTFELKALNETSMPVCSTLPDQSPTAAFIQKEGETPLTR